MPTPSIQTLRNDAQQVLNLDSISAVRSVVAATLANANAGTPLNPNLTTQQLWNEFYQIVTQPKSDIESIIANQLMKFMYAPPAPGGVGGNQQVIYNDNGVLAGDTKFLWDDALNKLDIDGSATITGDLTVRTTGLTVNSSGVGVGTSSQSSFLGNSPKKLVIGDGTQTPALTLYGGSANVSGIYYAKGTVGNQTYRGFFEYDHSVDALAFGIAGSTAMTLNATGLGVGTSPTNRFTIGVGTYNPAVAQTSNLYTEATRGLIVLSDGFTVATRTGSNMLILDTTGNVGIGVTPSAGGSIFYKTLELGKAGCGLFAGTTSLSVGSELIYLSGNAVLAYNAGPEWKYGNDGVAAIYSIENGVHNWYNATSGTAGGVFTPTQAMTLAANGQLLLGTTSTSGVVDTAMVMDKSSGSGFVGNVYRMGGVDKGYSYLSSASASMLYETVTGYVIRMVSATNGVYLANGGTSWLTISDERNKDIIEPISNAVAKVGSLRSVIGKFKSETEGTRRSFLIAQDVQAVLPEAVDSTNPNELAVSYTDVIPLLVAAIKELTAEVNALKKA